MWLLILALQFPAVDLARPLELGQEPVEIVLIAAQDAEARQRVDAIVADPDENLILRLRGVEADAEPGVSWEVSVASSDPDDRDNVPRLAGILSLYGAPPGGEHVFPMDPAIQAGVPAGLKIIFTPISGVEVDGEPVPPVVRASVRIGGLSLETESAAAASPCRRARW